METTKLSLASQLKAEFMERYGLREDQVHIDVTVFTADLEQGRTILADYNKRLQSDVLLPEGDSCDFVYCDDIYQVGVHRKDGFYGTYVTKDVDDDES